MRISTVVKADKNFIIKFLIKLKNRQKFFIEDQTSIYFSKSYHPTFFPIHGFAINLGDDDDN